jgi:MerR family Zn(II)-responsive transcriptional regulator of zntA
MAASLALQGDLRPRTTPMRIGELARMTRLSADTLRAYEKKGLVKPSARSRGRFREYGADAVAQVRRVQDALALGFTLAQLSAFSRERAKGRPPCRAVRAAAFAQLRHVESELVRLNHLRTALQRTLRIWDERLAAADPPKPLALLDDLRSEGDLPRAKVRPTFRSRSSCCR